MTWRAPVTAAATAPASSISSWTTTSGRPRDRRAARGRRRAGDRSSTKYSGESAARPPAAACVDPIDQVVEAVGGDVGDEVRTGRDDDVVTGAAAPPAASGRIVLTWPYIGPAAEEDPHAVDRDAPPRARVMETAWRSGEPSAGRAGRRRRRARRRRRLDVVGAQTSAGCASHAVERGASARPWSSARRSSSPSTVVVGLADVVVSTVVVTVVDGRRRAWSSG